MQKRSLVVIEWEDIATYSSWRNEKKTTDVNPILCQTVGWRMKAPSPKKIAVASTRNSIGECCDLTIIPRVSIKSIRRLE